METLGDCSACIRRATGFESKETQSKKIKVYLNPNNDIVFIDLATGGKAFVHVFDAQGKLVGKKQINNTASRIHLDLTYLIKGIYIVEVIQRQQRFRTKVLIQ